MYVIFIRNLFLNSSSEVISKLLLSKKKNLVCEIAIKLELFLITFKVYTSTYTTYMFYVSNKISMIIGY